MSTLATWPAQAQSWLDDRGKPAWMIAMVLGFIFFWPVGLALLFYMIWSKRMFNGNCGRGTNRGMNGKMGRKMGRGNHGRDAMHPSGNSAFDAYKADTLRRLEDEQQNFESFLGRLRDAKDKAEFDDFMRERADAANDAGREDTPDDAPGKS